MSEAAVSAALPLPVGGLGRRSVGWWGLVFAITTEAALFGYLLFSYYYFFVQLGRDWNPEPHPSLALALPNTVILLASSVTVWWAERATRRGARGTALVALAATLILGIIFVGVQYVEWRAKPFSISSGSYGSLYFTITGFHMAHVIAGLIMLSLITVWNALGYFDRARHVPMLIGAAYWHFVDLVWLFVFSTFYLVPRIW